MLNILLAQCKQEISSFNPVPGRYQDFVVAVGEAVLANRDAAQGEVAGALSVFGARDDVRVVPAYSAQATTSGGTLRGADFDQIAAEFLAALRAAPPVDGVYFVLHGAMAAENESDPEGLLLAEARKILGEQ